MSEYTVNRTHGHGLRKFLNRNKLMLITEMWNKSGVQHSKKILVDKKTNLVLVDIITATNPDRSATCRYSIKVPSPLSKFQKRAIIKVLSYHTIIGMDIDKKNLIVSNNVKFTKDA